MCSDTVKGEKKNKQTKQHTNIEISVALIKAVFRQIQRKMMHYKARWPSGKTFHPELLKRRPAGERNQ